MKTLQNITKTLLIATSFFAVASCSKDDDNNNQVPVTPVPANTSFVTATVDGAAFTSILFGTSIASASRSGSGDMTLIQVLGSNFSADNIALNLLGITTTGTYTIDPSLDGSVMAFTPGSGGVSYSTGECSGSGGTLIVTAIDNTKIEGTFSFTGKDVDNCESSATKTVTNGTFKGVFVN